ncbi:MAG: hypothetical protein COB53_10755 [Elusimicrobia bacterium]|nr:MAG: hypothetical protein COB53_10755 [Elusimicrobiota bacterium]
MAMITLYEDAAQRFSVEEDKTGRLWLSIPLRDREISEIHMTLTPFEIRDFNEAPSSLEAKVRFVMHNPRRHFDKREEAEYRNQ